MAEELDWCGQNVVVRNGKEGGLRVYHNVPYGFAITLPRKDIVNTFFASPVEST